MNTIKQSIITIIICMAVVAGVSLVSAWTGPLQAPPGCTSGNPGCDAPINVSNAAQQKTGALRVGGFISDMDAYLATLGGNVGIGTAAPGTNKLQVNGKIQAVGGDICTDQGGGKCLSTAGVAGTSIKLINCAWAGTAWEPVESCPSNKVITAINHNWHSADKVNVYCCNLSL